MKYNNYLKKNNQGFTILELMIATSIFGVMLLLATSGMLQIGRAYYKAITNSKTQEITRTISRDISETVQFSGRVTPQNGGPDATPYQVRAVCIGNNRYSYALNSQVRPENNPTPAAGQTRTIQHALWVDVKKDGSACTPLDLRRTDPSRDPPIDATVNQSSDALAQARELLATNMRLTVFDIRSNSSGTGVEVNVKTMYGDNDIIDDMSTVADTTDDTCRPNRQGGQFCAYSQLSTFVKRRL